MAEISLRAYNREIEEMIENGQIEEAIAHCKYILRQFPKHIDTYRSLGKAYLEAKRYSEAADILQRVLSAFPDDRVAQLGMSIIREDEGNLDAAIYHMERAFEVQPSNAAIQEELRRLYGRRDGVEPSKVRLTRGALVRMYERGQLYLQAIAEAKAALAEEPQRVDLMVVLAKVYYITGKKVEASEVCSRLITRLPYCFEANRILAEILTTTSHSENAKVYRQRLQSLDPYIASPETPDSNQVPDNSVMLEKLEWHPSQETGQIPEWTRTVGIGFEPEEEKLPSWLDTIPQTIPAVEPELESPIETVTRPSEHELPSATEVGLQAMSEEQPQEEVLPSWMSEAGWTISEGKESAESIVKFGEEGEAVEPAELPDWVKSLAPQPQPESFIEEESKEELEALEKILPPLFETPESSVETAFEQLPLSSEEVNLPAELPDFLAPVEEPQTILPQATLSEQAETPLSTEQVDLLAQTEKSEIPPPQVEDLEGEWQSLLEQSTAKEVAGESLPPEQPAIDELDIDAAMAWLENLAARQGAEEETLITSPEQRLEQPPEWIQHQTESMEKLQKEEHAEIIAPQPELSEQEVLPPFEEQLVVKSGVTPLDETSQKDIDEAFAWLETLAARQGAEEGLLTTPEERKETPPEWVTQEQIWQPAGEVLEIPEEEPILSEELPDWLKILETTESEQPVAEATQEASEEILPSWLREIEAEELTPEQESITTHPEWIGEIEPVVEEEKPILQVLEEFEPEQQTPKEQLSESQLEGELPAWLHDIEMPAIETIVEPTQSVQTIQESTVNTEEAPAMEWKQEAISESETVEGESKLKLEREIETIGESSYPPIEVPLPSQELSREIVQGPPMETEMIGEETVEFSPVSEMLQKEVTPSEQEEIPPETEQPQMISKPQPITVEESPQTFEQEMSPETIETPATIARVTEAVKISVERKTQPTEEKLREAQAELEKGKLQSALEKYSELIESETFLEQTIHDIRDALYRYPLDIGLWQALGDAYLRGNRLQDALDAYTKAEELIR